MQDFNHYVLSVRTAIYYMYKLIFNSALFKFFWASVLTVVSTVPVESYYIYHIVIWIWLASMLLWIWNWVKQVWFSWIKLKLWFLRLAVYVIMLFIADCLVRFSLLSFWMIFMSTYILLELALSIIKHSIWLGIKMPRIQKVIEYQEKKFIDKFMDWKKGI